MNIQYNSDSAPLLHCITHPLHYSDASSSASNTCPSTRPMGM
jgi:hypothetical protein